MFPLESLFHLLFCIRCLHSHTSLKTNYNYSTREPQYYIHIPKSSKSFAKRYCTVEYTSTCQYHLEYIISLMFFSFFLRNMNEIRFSFSFCLILLLLFFVCRFFFFYRVWEKSGIYFLERWLLISKITPLVLS